MTDLPGSERCYRCLRPVSLCYCADLPSIATRTRIEILQHPHERTHPFGTARLLGLCMPNASVTVPFAGFTGTLSNPLDVPRDAAVLFPHPDAEDLETLPAEDRPSTLIALDGTWSHVKRLYRENEWLHGLRHVRLQPAEPSRYRIRKEPKPEYISTLEAVVVALRVLEPDNHAVERLITAFDQMIDLQISHRSTRTDVRHRHARNKARRAVPPAVLDPRLVVVYAEAAMPRECSETVGDRELLHWVAAKVDTGDTHESILSPAGAGPTDIHLRHVQLSREDLRNGIDAAEARTRFLQFLPEGAPIAAWTGTSFLWGKSMLPTSNERTLLKTSYCNVAQRRAGYMEQVLERESLQPADIPCRGRAGDRLANAIAIARWLQQSVRNP